MNRCVECSTTPVARKLTETMNAFLTATYFALAVAVTGAAAARPTAPFVLVITDPAASAVGNMSVLQRAGGAFVWAGRVPWISVAHSDAPDFVDRLHEAGALLVLDHDLALGCLQGQQT